MAFEEFGEWEVRAEEHGKPRLRCVFPQTHPEEAVVLLAQVARVRFQIPPGGWRPWAFVCARLDRTEAGEAVIFGMSSSSETPIRVAEFNRVASRLFESEFVRLSS